MNKLLKIAAVSCFAITAGSMATAATLKLDFDGLAANSGLASVTVGSTIFNFTSTGGSVNLFDTLDPTTSDHVNDDDIIPAVQGENGIAGNVLILQTPGNPLANDLAGGGTITLTQAGGPALSFVGASVIDDEEIDFSTSIDGFLDGVNLAADKDTASLNFASSFLGVGDSLTITYFGSGAVDSLVFQESLGVVPVPASLPLLLGGLVGFGYVARRRQSRKA